MLAGEPDLEVVGEATTGREAIDLCRRLAPDLVLMDVRMPDMDGLAATEAIRADNPDTQVVIVTLYENPDYLLQALRAGAAGYVLKDANRQEVVAAVRQVLRGEVLLNHEVATRVVRHLVDEGTGRGALGEPLTRREREVLQLLAQGMTNREIAGHLNVSVGTVKVHVERIISKLGASDRTQAAVRAVELGLVSRSTE